MVIDGRIRFVLGDEEVVAEAGDFVYTPPNLPHTYVVESETARMIGFNHPSGPFEALQRKAAPLFQTGGPPDMEALVKLAAEHQVTVLGPPLAPA